MSKYSREIVAQVLAACDIVDVIGACLELKPGGAGRFKACCPFHNEKTPSFTVSRDRQQYYCFGCEKHGDAINFLVDYEGLTFPEALRKLADRAGIRLPAATEQDDKEDYLRAQLIELGKFAAGFFRSMLDEVMKGSAARQYLKTRELKPETIKRFGIGYAPEGWSALLDAARAKGFKDTVLEASGLAKRGDRGLYDFFRNRLMIPIRDVSANVVAFGGRDLGDAVPKYINSPENALYKKQRVLYGLYEAREAMRQEKRVILVEGYFDMMRCFDAGIENVVATCGTALTQEQSALIRRYVPEVVVVYDADAAGVRAAVRGVGLLTNAGLTVRAMTLPDGKDPDDYIRAHGADAFRDLVEGSLDFVTFYVRMSRDRTQTIEGRTTVAKEIFSILTALTDQLRLSEYLRHTAKELQLNEWTCQTEFNKFLREQTARATHPETPAAPGESVTQDDQDFVAALLSDPALLRQAQAALTSVPLEPGPLTEIIQALFQGTEADVALRLSTEPARRLYAAAANVHKLPPDKVSAIVEKRIIRIKKDSLQAEAARVQRELSEAERAHDQARFLELLKKKTGIDRQMENVGVV